MPPCRTLLELVWVRLYLHVRSHTLQFSSNVKVKENTDRIKISKVRKNAILIDTSVLVRVDVRIFCPIQ